MKTIKDCVNYLVTPNHTGHITYLDFELSSSSPAELSIKPVKEFIDLSPRRTEVVLTREQNDDILRFHSVSAVELSATTLANQDEQTVSKNIIAKMWNLGYTSYVNSFTPFQKWANKWFGYEPLQLIKTDADLVRVINLHSNRIAVKSRRGPGNFVVVSSQIGAMLQEQPNFVFEPLEGVLNPGGLSYKIGSLNGRIEVYVDPYMKWTERTFIIGKSTRDNDPGLYYVTCDNVEYSEIEMNDPTRAVKHSHVRWDWLGTVGKSAEDHFFLVKTTDKKHNLWKHLISKYLKI